MMHIPPYYKKASWQRFLAGTFVGAIIAYVVFIYMYGDYFEQWIEENLEIRADYNELKNNYEALEESKQQLDEEAKEKITVDTIEIYHDSKNQERLKLDNLTVHQIKEQMKEQLKDVIGKDIISLSENYKLIITAIENKTYAVDDFKYEVLVKQLFILPSSPAKLITHVEFRIAN